MKRRHFSADSFDEKISTGTLYRLTKGGLIALTPKEGEAFERVCRGSTLTHPTPLAGWLQIQKLPPQKF